jgi:hypothetical protein
MKPVLLAIGLALLLAGPAQASWAENANMRNPVFTGTDRSLAEAQHQRIYRGHRMHRIHRIHRDSWNRTYR